MLTSAILEPFWIQGGPKNGPFGHNFLQQRLKTSSSKVDPGRLGAGLGAKWHRKRPKTTQGSNLIDFLMNLDSFGIDFL